ncbi:ATP-binding protein [Actinoallomurus sp. NPDC052308]|uniref:ATP-binding protein n=1 Tax=Actinoallomurus sp. NPDC052308 TaxID=3155530 RepID=UPI00341E75AC
MSELATNAYRHTQRPATLYYSEWDYRPWIEVVDESTTFPDFHVIDTLGENGRGLKTISRLSAICGYCRIDHGGFVGKMVFSAPRKDEDVKNDDYFDDSWLAHEKLGEDLVDNRRTRGNRLVETAIAETLVRP